MANGDKGIFKSLGKVLDVGQNRIAKRLSGQWYDTKTGKNISDIEKERFEKTGSFNAPVSTKFEQRNYLQQKTETPSILIERGIPISNNKVPIIGEDKKVIAQPKSTSVYRGNIVSEEQPIEQPESTVNIDDLDESKFNEQQIAVDANLLDTASLFQPESTINGTSPSKRKSDFSVDENNLIASASQLVALGMNVDALKKDQLIEPSEGISFTPTSRVQLKGASIYRPAKAAIDANFARSLNLARETGNLEVIPGITANTNKAIVDATTAQGRSDLDVLNKNILINSRIESENKRLRTRLDVINKQATDKFYSDKFNIVNADKNAIYKGINNLAALRINSNDKKEIAKLRSLYGDQSFVTGLIG